MSQEFDLPSTSDKWWELVWFLPATTPRPADLSWQELSAHSCGGFSCNSLDGWVKPLPMATLQDVQQAIVDESWCTGQLGLDYEVSEVAKAEYAAFLAKHGLEAGELNALRQAVYPLARTSKVCARFGIEQTAESHAALVLLGQNCD